MPLYFQMSRNDSRQSECKVTNFFEILTFRRGDPAKISFGRAKAACRWDWGHHIFEARIWL